MPFGLKMFITKNSLSGKKSLLPSLIMQKKLTVELQKSYSKNYTKSCNHENYAKDIELSKKYWEIKRSIFVPKVTWSIVRKCPPYNLSKRKSYLRLNEKLEINSFKGNNLLNKKSEL